EPVELERLLQCAELEGGAGEAGERVRLLARGGDLAALGLGGLDGRLHAQVGPVVEVRHAGERGARLLGERRLRVRAEQLVAHAAPATPPRSGVAGCADVGVQLEDLPLPVEQGQPVERHARYAASRSACGTRARSWWTVVWQT